MFATVIVLHVLDYIFISSNFQRDDKKRVINKQIYTNAESEVLSGK